MVFAGIIVFLIMLGGVYAIIGRSIGITFCLIVLFGAWFAGVYEVVWYASAQILGILFGAASAFIGIIFGA